MAHNGEAEGERKDIQIGEAIVRLGEAAVKDDIEALHREQENLDRLGVPAFIILAIVTALVVAVAS